MIVQIRTKLYESVLILIRGSAVLIIKSNKRKQGISPIIATVILSSIAIAVAIGVAYWVTGLIPMLTAREEVRITGCYIQNSTIAIIHVKNTGSIDVTIDYIRINARLSNPDKPLNIVVKPSEMKKIEANAEDVETVKKFVSGVRYDFSIHTTSGLNFPASARAP